MSIRIEINESQLSTLVSVYNNRIKELKDEIALLEGTLNQMLVQKKAERNHSNNGSLTLFSDSSTGYSPIWKWQRKIDYILRKHGELTSAQVVDMVLEYEPDKKLERSKVMATVSAVLSANATKEGGKYDRVKNERDDYVYIIKKEQL